MSDIVKRDTDGWAVVLPAVGDLATKIAQTEFVPDSLRGKPAAIAAAILYGRELGLEPMTSLRSVNVIKGKPALSAEAMRALVLAAGHDIRFQEMTSARCVIVGKRKGQDETTTVTFTMDDAKKMGVGGGQQYSKMPRQMLAARATAELCRLIFADAIGGLQVDVEVDDEAESIATVTPMTTAKRKKAAPKDEAPPPPPQPPHKSRPMAVQGDPEPVLDDDIVEAELVDEPADPAVSLIQDELGGEVVETKPSGPALLRAALKGEVVVDEVVTDQPVTKNQLKAIFAGFRDCGITDREEMRDLTIALAERPGLQSSNELTTKEASAVLDALAFAKDSDDPADLIRKAAG
jgi:hypothetical protein